MAPAASSWFLLKYDVKFCVRNPSSIPEERMMALEQDFRDFAEFYDYHDCVFVGEDQQLCYFFGNVPRQIVQQMRALKFVDDRETWLTIKMRPMKS